jgi:hypothetical protein
MTFSMMAWGDVCAAAMDGTPIPVACSAAAPRPGIDGRVHTDFAEADR